MKPHAQIKIDTQDYFFYVVYRRLTIQVPTISEALDCSFQGPMRDGEFSPLMGVDYENQARDKNRNK